MAFVPDGHIDTIYTIGTIDSGPVVGHPACPAGVVQLGGFPVEEEFRLMVVGKQKRRTQALVVS